MVDYYKPFTSVIKHLQSITTFLCLLQGFMKIIHACYSKFDEQNWHQIIVTKKKNYKRNNKKIKSINNTI